MITRLQYPTSNGCLLVMTLSLIYLEVAIAIAPSIAKDGCKDRCGEISIPFPFGIGPNCSYSSWFDITCKNTSQSHPQKPFLTKFDLEVFNIPTRYQDQQDGSIWSSYPNTLTVGIAPFKVCTNMNVTRFTSLDLRKSPFRFSYHNYFVLQGSEGTAVLKGTEIDTDCYTNSTNQLCQKYPFDQLMNDDVSPLGYYGMDYFQVDLYRYPSGTDEADSQGCIFATLMDSNYKSGDQRLFSTSKNYNSSPVLPTILNWIYPDISYSPETHPYTDCYEGTCACLNGYIGNPYLPYGCETVKECINCYGTCASDGNSYFCTDFTTHRSVAERVMAIVIECKIGLILHGVRVGIFLTVVCSYFSFRAVKKILDMRRKRKNFKQNGGLLLQQHLLSKKGAPEKTKIFTTKDLEKATDLFSEDRILGQGGQGIVYKGILADGRTVAIKRSEQVDKRQVENFVNEVVILSQINHKNVVKLLGCCLETEVPLLVYEFISNGTLHQQIHHPNEDFQLTWEMRLKIAFESAGAIAYLHSSSSPPIYHRDVKSSNILLDEKKRAKVSDFGCSKSIAVDQTHLTTLHVLGTFGYLDPEYFYSNQFTDKSDVYSFGVVLVELLTSKKPILKYEESSEYKGLAIEFIHMLDSGCLMEFLDPKLVKEANEEIILAVAELAKQCLKSNGKMRPTMRQVATSLEMIIKGVPIPKQESSPQEAGEHHLIIPAALESPQFRSVPFQSGHVDSFSIYEEPMLFNSM